MEEYQKFEYVFRWYLRCGRWAWGRWHHRTGKQVDVCGSLIQLFGYNSETMTFCIALFKEGSLVECCRRTNGSTWSSSISRLHWPVTNDVTRNMSPISVYLNNPQTRILAPPAWRVPCPAGKTDPLLHEVSAVLVLCHRHVSTWILTHQFKQRIFRFLGSSFDDPVLMLSNVLCNVQSSELPSWNDDFCPPYLEDCFGWHSCLHDVVHQR